MTGSGVAEAPGGFLGQAGFLRGWGGAARTLRLGCQEPTRSLQGLEERGSQMAPFLCWWLRG